MKMKIKAVFVIKVVLGIAIICYILFGSQVHRELRCNADSDCVANACCHASGAVNKAFAVNCTDMLCSMDCVENTLDCGQMKIACVKNKCAVVKL